MTYTKTFIFLLVASVSFVQTLDRRWFPAQLNDITVNDAVKTQTVLEDKGSRVALECTFEGWCHAFCKEGPGKYVILQMSVVAGNVDPAGPPFLECYTDRENGNILTGQSNITIHSSSAVASTYPLRDASCWMDFVVIILITTLVQVQVQGTLFST